MGTESTAEGGAETQIETAATWAALKLKAWCPVLFEAPLPDMPWPSNTPAAFSPPKMTRLPRDAWLASGSMRILDGECSDALAERLGWQEPVEPVNLAAQLLELGKLHSEVSGARGGAASDTAWLCRLLDVCKFLAAWVGLFFKWAGGQAIRANIAWPGPCAPSDPSDSIDWFALGASLTLVHIQHTLTEPSQAS